MRPIASVTLMFLAACTHSYERADSLAPGAASATAAAQLDCSPQELSLANGISQLDEAANLKRYWYSVKGCGAEGELRADCTEEKCEVTMLRVDHPPSPSTPFVQHWALDVYFEGPNRGERPWPLPKTDLEYSSVRCVFGETCLPKCTTELPASSDPRAVQMTCDQLKPVPVTNETIAALTQVMAGKTSLWPPQLDDQGLHRVELVLRSPKCAETIEDRIGAPEAFLNKAGGGTLTSVTLYRQAGLFRTTDAPRPRQRRMAFSIAAGRVERAYKKTTLMPSATPWGAFGWSGKPELTPPDAGVPQLRANDVPQPEWDALSRGYFHPEAADARFESAIAHLLAGEVHAAASEYREWEALGAPAGSAPEEPDSRSTFAALFEGLENGTAWLDDPCSH